MTLGGASPAGLWTLPEVHSAVAQGRVVPGASCADAPELPCPEDERVLPPVEVALLSGLRGALDASDHPVL